METALVAASIAALASTVGAVVSWFGAFQARRTVIRHHAWERFTWALRQQPHDRAYDISIAVLRNLATVSWWPEPDRRLAYRALRRRERAAADAERPQGPTAGQEADS
ncbi:hypothetical protein [Curtobacterium citreum]|uniref:hypothetical protein n=1 Tax=Curtobacterium citreum TaxID=2036 RepID=UPI000735F12C|nr:hypothetical protein [Curtobacterium citreum]KTR18170.1 hypothetical protein NS330_09420 [Curtobacterium citreum]